MSKPTHPIALPSTLSANARTLYARATDHHISLEIDRDWLDPQAPRMSKYARGEMKVDPGYVMSTDLRLAVKELEDAGLASLYEREGAKPSLRATKVSKRYATFVGDGSWVARLSILPTMSSDKHHDPLLLAALDGADVDIRTRDSEKTLVLRCRIPGTQDFEHSSASSAYFEIAFPSFPEMHSSWMGFYGVLGEAKMYPLGTDPRLLDEHDGGTEVVYEEPNRCAYEQCVGEYAHFVAPYLPPSLKVAGAGGVKVYLDLRMKDSQD